MTDDKDYFKVMADAPLNLENGTASAMPRIVREDIRGNPQSCTSTYVRKEQSDSENTGACRKSEAKTYGTHWKKGCVGSFRYGLVHEPVSVHEAMKIPGAKAAVDVGKIEEHSSMGRKQGEIRV